MDQYTFGKTPAAMYLVRFLNDIEDSILNRSISRRINSTNITVRDLINAYDCQNISSKTVANCLRLMREEIVNDIDCNIYVGTSVSIVDQLRRNVQIGIIKCGLRLCSISNKAERVMRNPEYRSSEREVIEVDGGFETHYKFRDSQSGKLYSAGMVADIDDGEYVGREVFITHHEQSDVDYITPELLHERSDRRCLRQGKPHMTKIEGGFEHPIA